MIHIDRKKVAAPSILADKESAGKKETERNIKKAEKKDWNNFRFKIYADPTVKKALIKLFHGKCAYCESKFLHVYPGDVEHFRPGRIAEAQARSFGYYWLGADWENLLLSCRNCNQKLGHEIAGSSDKIVMGKMDQFPIKAGQVHVDSHVDHPKRIAEEDKYRLLVDPCKDNPEEFFEFELSTGVIRAKMIDGKPSEKASKSIEVYVLQRVPLVQAREKLLKEITAQEVRVREAIMRYDACLADPDNRNLFRLVEAEIIMKRELERLKRYTDPTEEFSGMARQRVKSFMNSILNSNGA
jgi:uncharacterized protein (TIGR02646 family)